MSMCKFLSLALVQLVARGLGGPACPRANDTVGLLQLRKTKDERAVQLTEDGCCIKIDASNTSSPKLVGTEHSTAEQCYHPTEGQDADGVCRFLVHSCTEDVINDLLNPKNWPSVEGGPVRESSELNQSVEVLLGASSNAVAATSTTAVAQGYTVFEDFEAPGWPYSGLTYLSTSRFGVVTSNPGAGAEGTASYLHGPSYSSWLPGATWDVASGYPVTSQTGTTLQAWVRFPSRDDSCSLCFGEVYIGFDTNAFGTRGFRLSDYGGTSMVYKFYDNTYALGFGASVSESSQGTANASEFVDQWLRVLITILSDREVVARVYDNPGNLKLERALNWEDEFDGRLFSQSGAAWVKVAFERHVDQLAICQATFAHELVNDQGLCSSSVLPLTDVCIPDMAYACSPSPLPLGTQNVTCTGSAPNTSQSYAFQVVVADSEVPVFVSVPTEVTAETCNDSAQVSFIVEATDNCEVSVQCTPASGSEFTLGSHTVTCTATDASGNAANTSFAVIVAFRDDTPPVFVAHNDITTSTCHDFAQVIYQVEVADNCGEVVPGVPICGPASGSLFPVGSTPVYCTAADPSGNVANMSFFVNVTADSTPPVFTDLPDMTADAGCKDWTQVSFSAEATDPCGSVVTSCTPCSGSWFPVGNTTVVCTATDRSGNMANTSFQLAVNTALQPPTFNHYPDIYAEAKHGERKVSVSFDVAAGGCGEVKCIPASGSLFKRGSTKVTCSATNDAGTARTSFRVKVSRKEHYSKAARDKDDD